MISVTIGCSAPAGFLPVCEFCTDPKDLALFTVRWVGPRASGKFDDTQRPLCHRCATLFVFQLVSEGLAR